MSRETVSVKSIENLTDEIGGLLAGQKSNAQDQKLDQIIGLLQPTINEIKVTGRTDQLIPHVIANTSVNLPHQQFGMCAKTGKRLSGIDHLKQSINDILTTLVNTRVMRRDYGSMIPSCIDMPTNRQNLLQLYVHIADALKRWEPRLDLLRIKFHSLTASGKLSINLDAKYLGHQITIDGVIL